MIAFALTGILIGVILGSHFTVHAIVPAAIFALIVAAASAAMRGYPLWAALGELAFLLVFVQAGYGLSAAYVMRPTHFHSQRQS